MATKKRPTSQVIPTSKSANSNAGTYGTAAKEGAILVTPGGSVPIVLERVPAKLVKDAEFSTHEKSSKDLPEATVRALDELKAGRLTSGADADEMFRKLGIPLAKTKA
jgi:hypothetical protein